MGEERGQRGLKLFSEALADAREEERRDFSDRDDLWLFEGRRITFPDMPGQGFSPGKLLLALAHGQMDTEGMTVKYPHLEGRAIVSYFSFKFSLPGAACLANVCARLCGVGAGGVDEVVQSMVEDLELGGEEAQPLAKMVQWGEGLAAGRTQLPLPEITGGEIRYESFAEMLAKSGEKELLKIFPWVGVSCSPSSPGVVSLWPVPLPIPGEENDGAYRFNLYAAPLLVALAHVTSSHASVATAKYPLVSETGGRVREHFGLSMIGDNGSTYWKVLDTAAQTLGLRNWDMVNQMVRIYGQQLGIDPKKIEQFS